MLTFSEFFAYFFYVTLEAGLIIFIDLKKEKRGEVKVSTPCEVELTTFKLSDLRDGYCANEAILRVQSVYSLRGNYLLK